MLSILSVSKHYAAKTALNKVSLKAEQGKITGLLGPNGAGKTSLIRIITRITAPDEGEVLMDGKPMSAESSRQIGYLPEERGLYRKMTVIEQARYFGQLKGLSKSQCDATTDEWLTRLDMNSWKNKKLEELSKGMQQKVQFVLTVLHQPKLIILDEPFSGFDPLNAEIIKKEIIALKHAGACIILSTHRMESVEELCDDIVLINQGQVILEGTVTEVRKSYQKSEYSFRYLGSLPNSIPGVSKRSDKVLMDGTTQSLLTLEPGASLKEIISMINQEVELHDFKEELPTIKDIFIDRLAQPL